MGNPRAAKQHHFRSKARAEDKVNVVRMEQLLSGSSVFAKEGNEDADLRRDILAALSNYLEWTTGALQAKLQKRIDIRRIEITLTRLLNEKQIESKWLKSVGFLYKLIGEKPAVDTSQLTFGQKVPVQEVSAKLPFPKLADSNPYIKHEIKFADGPEVAIFAAIHDGKWRTIRIEVARADLVARTKPGYYAR